MSIPADLSYPDFLDKVGLIEKSNFSGPPIYYWDLYELVIKRLGGQSIKTYREFLDKCGNLGNLFYWDLYVKLYKDNENVKVSKKNNKNTKGGKRRKSRLTRRNK